MHPFQAHTVHPVRRALGAGMQATVLVALLCTCAQSPVVALADPTDATHVLFIGNSYLYTRDIPGIVQAMADSARGEKLAMETIAGPDMALIDHWNQGAARNAIARGGWTWVVLQQGPSSTAINRDSLRLVTRLFADAITRAGARVALLSAWPAESRRVDFPRAIESYTLASSDVGARLLPVAAAWSTAWDADAGVALYSDGLHPSATGAYLGALVIYAGLLEKTPRGLPGALMLRSGATIVVTPQRAAMLQEVAAQAIAAKGTSAAERGPVSACTPSRCAPAGPSGRSP